jgi:hypothetical protein
MTFDEILALCVMCHVLSSCYVHIYSLLPLVFLPVFGNPMLDAAMHMYVMFVMYVCAVRIIRLDLTDERSGGNRPWMYCTNVGTMNKIT